MNDRRTALYAIRPIAKDEQVINMSNLKFFNFSLLFLLCSVVHDIEKRGGNCLRDFENKNSC